MALNSSLMRLFKSDRFTNGNTQQLVRPSEGADLYPRLSSESQVGRTRLISRVDVMIYTTSLGGGSSR